jgi:hypothetical protein
MAVMVKKDVKSKGEIIGQVEYNEPQTSAEAVEMFGEEGSLDLLKYALMVKRMNAFRTSATSSGIPKDVQKQLRSNPELLKKVLEELAKRA